MIEQVLEVVKGAGEAVPDAELERLLGVSSDEERRALVSALGKLLFDRHVLQFDQQSGGYRTRQGEDP